MKHLLEKSLFVTGAIKSALPLTGLTPAGRNWCDIYTNVFGVNEIRPRIGTFTTPWNFTIPNPHGVIDSSQSTDKTLAELLDQRAVDLYKESLRRNKKIVIMWSGGIDSTAVLSAFIKNLSSDELANIIVCFNTESVEENPYFYHTQIRDRLEILHLLDLNVSNEFLDKHIMLTGDPADCIVGPSVIKFKSLIDDGRHMLSWKDNIPLLYKIYESADNPLFAKWWVDKVSANLDEVQSQGLFTRVVTIADWHWWQYYNIKYNGSFVRPYTKHKQNDKELITQQNIREHFDLNFFGHNDFQLWSYTNLPKLLAKGLQFHKREFKDYIYELDGNLDYHSNKIKIASWNIQNKNLIFMDNDCVMYRAHEPGVKEAINECLAEYRG